MHRMIHDVWMLSFFFVGPYARSPVSSLLADRCEWDKKMVRDLPRILLLLIRYYLYREKICICIVYTITEKSQWKWYTRYLHLHLTHTWLNGGTLPQYCYSEELKLEIKLHACGHWKTRCCREQGWSQVGVFRLCLLYWGRYLGKNFNKSIFSRRRDIHNSSFRVKDH